jgi:GntR family transcriptional regulator
MTSNADRKHERIAATLSNQIRSGRIQRGEQLPGEVELARRFSVSRSTVRSALAELSDAGLIATRSGKGSFVLFDGRPLDARRGWARALAAQGVNVRVRVLTVALVRNEKLSAQLGTATPEFVIVERVRELDELVVSFERSSVPAVGALRDLPQAGLGSDSLTEVLAGAGLFVDHGEQLTRARGVTPVEASVLGREPGTWFLDTRRTSWSAENEFVEHVQSLLDPEHFELMLEFSESAD